ncbi:S-adenosylmethionine decarboxylase [Atractiella rhizophila]|nr:S-adenosylmethionine decarboxylase [Atractiella rhizophila]
MDTSLTPSVPDGSDTPVAPFEGPEKLLEIWFAEDASACEGVGLLQVSKEQWVTMLDLVKCQVLSVLKGNGVHAYLLSESSMFVYPHKLVLKTCGTTTLLLGLERLLQIAKQSCGLEVVYRLFYSRKTFMFPEKQEGPHKDWQTEVEFLDKIFENGSAYTVGPMNGEHWLLYLTSTPFPPSPLKIGINPASSPRLQDQTLEILMSDLDDDHCKNFFQPPLSPILPSPISPSSNPSPSIGHVLGTEVSQHLGIDRISSPEKYITKLDSFLFEPCGYSANALVSSAPSEDSAKDKGGEDFYYSIHVTPSPREHTYASYETNQCFTSVSEIEETINRVVKIFRPGRIVVTWFVERQEEEEEGDVDWKKVRVDGFGKRERIRYEFEGYDLVFNTWEETKK